VLLVTRTTNGEGVSRELSPEISREFSSEISREFSSEISREFSSEISRECRRTEQTILL
jgi:hypothetical protein